MCKKPSYEVLQQRVEQLEEEIVELRRVKETLEETEERYRVFVEQSAEGIWCFESEKPILTTLPEDEQIEQFYKVAYLSECNDLMAKMYGYTSREEIIGARLGNLLIRSDPHNIEYLRSFIRSGYRLTNAESHESDREGNPHIFLNNFVGIVEDGKLMRTWGTQRDISESKRAEENLKLYREIFSNSKDGIAILDPQCYYLKQNSAHYSLLGYSNEEIRGKTPTTHLEEEAFSVIQQELAKSGSYRGEVTSRTKSGKILDIDLSAFAVRNHGGEPLCYVGIKRDITDRKQAEKALRESERRFREFVELLPEPVCETDESGNLIFVNRRSFDVFGYNQEDFKEGLNALQMLIPEDRAKALRNMGRVLRGENLGDVEYTALRKNGSTFPVLIYANRLIREGKPVGLRAIVIDISKRKRAEDALRESEEKYRNLVERANDGIAIVQESILKYVNPRLAQMAGYAVEEIIGTQFKDYIYPDQRSNVLAHNKKRMAGRKVPLNYEAALRHKNGTKIDVEFNAGVITYKEKPAAFAIVRDLTERKQAEEEKKGLEAQLIQAQKTEALGTLAGGIAHDFNNLLMTVQGNVSLMLFGMEEMHPNYEMLKNIEKQVQSGAKLTRQLLGYARKGKYEVQWINLNQLLEEISETFGRTRKQIRIQQNLADDLHAIEVDQGQIEQVLLNLCVNAADAMPRGGDLFLKTRNVTHKEIKGKLYDPKPGNYVLLMVSDTGTGMDKETQQHIFDPFFTTKEMGRGTGLGLASVYGIVKSHGGYIDVESEKSRGTTFMIYLPSSGRKAEKAIKSAGEVTKGSGTILIVDDEALVLDVGVKMLGHMGYEVLQAKGGEEAIQVYKSNKDDIDLVILDMIMPDMGGSEVYEMMKEINSNVRVLLSSGYSMDGQAREIMNRGCDGFIQKPFNMKELSGKVSKFLTQGQDGNFRTFHSN